MNLNAIHMNNPSDDITARKASTESPAVVTSTGGKSIKIRDALVALLTFGVGSVDALSFLTLGGVFASFMSGNTVTLGVRIGQGNFPLALNSLTAILGYIGGVALGANIAYPTGGQREIWPRAVTKTFAAEFLLLLLFAIVGFVSGNPGANAVYVLILLASVPMGMQSVGVYRLGVSGISTTYVTGTWTSFIIGLVTLRRSPSLRTVKQEQSTTLQAITLLVYVLGAATGGLAETYFLLKAAIIPVLSIGLVLLVASTRMR